MKDLEKMVSKLVHKYAQNKNIEFDLNLNLKNDLGYTSLTFICLIMEIEACFDFQFDDEYLNMDRLSNIKTIIDYVNKVVSADEKKQ